MTGAERLLAACRGQPVDATPVWFMRQAGGRLPGYQRLRAGHSVIEIAKTPALCAGVSAGAVEALGVDGAVLFADIMLLVEAMGVPMELLSSGPVIADPIRSDAAIAGLRTVDPGTDLGFVLEAIGLVRRAVAGSAAVIGILGGPFTLAAYLVEGAPSRDQLVARALMHGRPDAWHELLDRLAIAAAAYGVAQGRAGADVVQLFDTWASSLTADEYRRFVAPYAARIVAAVEASGVPVIHHVGRSVAILDEVAASGATVVGIDSRQGLRAARRRLGLSRAVQGNLDPALVLAGWGRVAPAVGSVVAAAGGGPGRPAIGHVFNLGEAAPRDADPSVLRDLAALVHDTTAGPSPVPEVSHVPA